MNIVESKVEVFSVPDGHLGYLVRNGQMQSIVSWTEPYESKSATANELLSCTMMNEVYQNNQAASKRNRKRKWTAVPASSSLFFFQHSLSESTSFQNWTQMLCEWPRSNTANSVQL
jgi:hypothetical protein